MIFAHNPDFRRRNLRFLNLNKDINGGGGNGGKSTPTVAELTQRLQEAETAKTTAEGERDAAMKERDEAKETITKVEGERDTAIKERDEAKETITKVEGERDTAMKERDTAVQAKEKAESDLKTADERAEQRLREIDAKNGGTLPGKKPGEGDHTQERQIDANASPLDRLTAAFEGKK